MTRSLKEISEYTRGILVGDGDLLIRAVASLDEAGEGEISFIAQKKYLSKLKTSRASAFIVPMGISEAHVPLIRTENPYLAYARAVTLLTAAPFKAMGISSEASIGDDCEIDPNVSIYPFSYIGNGVKIAAEVVIYPGVYVGNGVSIGCGTTIYPQAAIMDRCLIGNRVIIHSGAVIGSDGFGYAKDGNRHIKIPQTGIVKVDDDAEIGANTTIDRAALGKTWIKRGTKIDNLVQVAHNVTVGEDSILISQVGISGSVEIGNSVILAGQVGVAGHCKIGDRVMVGGKSGVTGTVEADSVVSGFPAIPHREWLKSSASYRRLPDMINELRTLRDRITALEAKVDAAKSQRPDGTAKGSSCTD